MYLLAALQGHLKAKENLPYLRKFPKNTDAAYELGVQFVLEKIHSTSEQHKQLLENQLRLLKENFDPHLGNKKIATFEEETNASLFQQKNTFFNSQKATEEKKPINQSMGGKVKEKELIVPKCFGPPP